MTRQRLDAALVARGLARSRGAATELIRAGAVLVDGLLAHRPAQLVDADTRLELTHRPAGWVGRAAHKLLVAFEVFGAVDPAPWTVAGRHCLDVGACTGGFTQVMLERGAARVVALDVGHDQLAPTLRADPRVEEVSGVSIRGVEATALGGPFDAVVADLSFISLRLVVPEIAAQIGPEGQAVLLVKPQFEVGRGRLGKNGVVKNPADRVSAVAGVLAACRAAGLAPRAVVPTGVPGSTGNHEYLGWVTRRADLALTDDEAAAADAVRTFEGR